MRELRDFISQLIEENPEFEDGELWCDCGDVLHRVVGCQNSQDMRKMTGEKVWSLVLMDEEAVDNELGQRDGFDEKLKSEHEEYF